MNDTAMIERPTEAAALPAPYDFAPRNLTEALAAAEMLASSTMVPKDYIGKPGNVLVAMQFGHELGLQPLQAMQSLAVINGKPGLYGDAGKALLIANGCEIIERDIAEIKTSGVAECTINRPGRRPVTRTFSKENAVTAKLWTKEGPWTTSPERQQAWRAFWFAARDAAPDILKGMKGSEELRDTPAEVEINPEQRQRPQSRSEREKASATDVNTTTGEIKNAEPDPAVRAEETEASSGGAPASMITLIKRKCEDGNASLDALLKGQGAALETLTVAQGNAILKALRG